MITYRYILLNHDYRFFPALIFVRKRIFQNYFSFIRTCNNQKKNYLCSVIKTTYNYEKGIKHSFCCHNFR